MDGSQAEALVVGRERPLQLLVVDEPAAILVRYPEASNDVRIGAGREGRGHQRRERAGVVRPRWRVSGPGGGRILFLGGLVAVRLGHGGVGRLTVRLWRWWRAVGCAVSLWRGRTVLATGRRSTVAVSGRIVRVA